MITASLATIPSREKALETTIKTLLPQVDRLWVYLNGYAETPQWLYISGYRNLYMYLGAKHAGDLGDAGKFFGLVHAEPGYHFTCDDDISYLPGYVDFMIEAIERYERKAIVTIHGKRINRTLTSYYRDRQGQDRFHNQVALNQDEIVDVPGTGVSAYHTDTIRFTLGDFPQTHRNMADVHVGLKAVREGVPIVCLAHTGMEVGLSPHLDHGKDSIFGKHYRDDRLQTEKVNELYRIKTARRAA